MLLIAIWLLNLRPGEAISIYKSKSSRSIFWDLEASGLHLLGSFPSVHLPRTAEDSKYSHSVRNWVNGDGNSFKKILFPSERIEMKSLTLSMPTLSGNTLITAWWTYKCSWRTPIIKLEGKHPLGGGSLRRGTGNPWALELYHKTKQNNLFNFLLSEFLLLCEERKLFIIISGDEIEPSWYLEIVS